LFSPSRNAARAGAGGALTATASRVPTSAGGRAPGRAWARLALAGVATGEPVVTGAAAIVLAGIRSAAPCTGLAAAKFSRETTVTPEGALRFT
jgi:hypothetical protein